MKAFTTIDKINAKAAYPLKSIFVDDSDTATVKVISLNISESKDGNTVVSFKTAEGYYISTVSATVYEQISEIMDADAEFDFNELSVTFMKKTSNSGKTFYQVSIGEIN